VTDVDDVREADVVVNDCTANAAYLMTTTPDPPAVPAVAVTPPEKQPLKMIVAPAAPPPPRFATPDPAPLD
jgi:hypothetical protein